MVLRRESRLNSQGELLNGLYHPQSFWNERFSKYGHTGEVDALLYTYDQPQRLRAIELTLARAGVSIGDKTKILDFGCGSGDLIALFLKRGRPEITAIDISDETIRYVQQRFADYPNVTALTLAVQDMAFPPDSFDLAVGINILQHILDDPTFTRAIEAILRVTKTGGHILVMDFSPVNVRNRLPAPYVIIRSRQEYIDIFERQGCKLMGEFGLPRLGVRLCRAIYGIASWLARGWRHSPTTSAEVTSPGNPSRSPGFKAQAIKIIETIVLAVAQPFDYLLVPFPARYTDMRLLLFEK